MKLTKILLMAFITLVFTTTLNADGDESKVCVKSRAGFWDTIKNTYNSADKSFVDSLDTASQQDYLISAKAQIQLNFNEVKILCRTIDKDILEAYEKKTSEIQSQLNAL